MSETEETPDKTDRSTSSYPPCTFPLSWFNALILIGIVILLTSTLLLYNFSKTGRLIPLNSLNPFSTRSAVDRKRKNQTRILPKPYRDITPPTSSRAPEKGRKLYNENCSSCHGKDGSGNGPVAEALTPQPQSFNDTNFIQRHSDRYLFWRISEGKRGTAMPSFKQTLSETERWYIVRYLRRLSAN